MKKSELIGRLDSIARLVSSHDKRIAVLESQPRPKTTEQLMSELNAARTVRFFGEGEEKIVIAGGEKAVPSQDVLGSHPPHGSPEDMAIVWKRATNVIRAAEPGAALTMALGRPVARINGPLQQWTIAFPEHHYPAAKDMSAGGEMQRLVSIALTQALGKPAFVTAAISSIDNYKETFIPAALFKPPQSAERKAYDENVHKLWALVFRWLRDENPRFPIEEAWALIDPTEVRKDLKPKATKPKLSSVLRQRITRKRAAADREARKKNHRKANDLRMEAGKMSRQLERVVAAEAKIPNA